MPPTSSRHQFVDVLIADLVSLVATSRIVLVVRSTGYISSIGWWHLGYLLFVTSLDCHGSVDVLFAHFVGYVLTTILGDVF